MSLDRVADDPTNLYPWRQLKDLREKLGIELEVVQAAFASEELERDVTGFQVLGEPGEWRMVSVCVCAPLPLWLGLPSTVYDQTT